MLKTNKQIKQIIIIALFAMFTLPSTVLAGTTGSYGSGSWGGNSGGWGSWGGGSPSYSSSPTYSYRPVYSSGSSYTPSYGGSNYGGYSLPTYGSSYTSSSIPSSNYTSNTTSNKNNNKNNNKNANSNTNTLNNKNNNANNNTNNNTSNSNSNSSSTSSASAVASSNNINNNNVYVYTNPTGNAVVYNPAHQALDGYCVITPSNPRTGQTVTATAYATGGIGNYRYTWGGDINAVSGASTSFTSYTTGIKYINITIRSDQEIITKTCTVTFENNSRNYGNYNNSYSSGSSVNLTPGITSGTPVSGVYLSQLPATGLSLSFFDYMIATMVVVLGAVFTFIYQARKRLNIENI